MSKLIYKPVATESPTSFSDDNTHSFTQLKQISPVHKDENKNKSLKQKKIWQDFPGKNSFYCDGYLITSHERGIFYLTCFLIITISTLYFIFDCPYLATEISIFIPITAALLLVFVLSNLLKTSAMDPGIIPRASKLEASYYEKLEVVEKNGEERRFKAPARTKEIIINGRPVTLKFCFTCKIFRPPRASHCSVCDNCVERFDHHCPWVGNCVGVRNYRYFYLFLLSLSLLSSFIFVTCLLHVYSISKTQGIFVGIKKSPASLVELIVCFLSMWSVIGLTGFHTYLIFTNTTTNEDMKGVFSQADETSNINPYGEKNCCINMGSIICGPQKPSLINRRGILKSESNVSIAMAASPTITTVTDTGMALNRGEGDVYFSGGQRLEDNVQGVMLGAGDGDGLVYLNSMEGNGNT